MKPGRPGAGGKSWWPLLALCACTSGDRGAAPAPPSPAATPVATPAPSPPPQDLPALGREALVHGAMPEGVPQAGLLENQCQTCHTLEYITQQRLTPPQWKKTVDKMRRFGATVDDEQAAALVAYAAHYWNPELADRVWEPVDPPAGALPLPAAKRGK